MKVEKRGWFQSGAILFLLLALAVTAYAVYAFYIGPLKKCNYQGTYCTNQPQPCKC
jgi:hypothetical protein